jgi:4-carboxymuconolactone decarboxylase
MTIDDSTRPELDALLGSFADTDPDLVGTLGAFAFDETPAASSLPQTDRLLYQLGALVAVGAGDPFRALLGAALDVGVTPVQAKEVVYQAVAYVGAARALGFVTATNEVLSARGVALPLGSQSTTTPADRMERGTAKQQEIVGADTVDAMYENAPADAVHFQRFLSANCFGDHYTRTGLDVRQRELLTFAVLVALGGADNQVKGHVAANRNVGNTRADLLDVLTVLVAHIGYPRTLNGLAAVNEGAPAAAPGTA